MAEVLVASVLLVIVMVGSLVTLQQGFLLLDTARNTTMADQILQSDLEDIRLLNWAALTTKYPNSTPQSITLDTELAARFTAIRTVADVANRNSNMKQITERVSWKDYRGVTHTRTYQTNFTHYGLNDYFVTTRPPS